MDGTCLLRFHLHLRGDSPILLVWIILWYAALCLVGFEARPLTSGNQTGNFWAPCSRSMSEGRYGGDQMIEVAT